MQRVEFGSIFRNKEEGLPSNGAQWQPKASVCPSGEDSGEIPDRQTANTKFAEGRVVPALHCSSAKEKGRRDRAALTLKSYWPSGMGGASSTPV